MNLIISFKRKYILNYIYCFNLIDIFIFLILFDNNLFKFYIIKDNIDYLYNKNKIKIRMD